jgi:hypothetical protein
LLLVAAQAATAAAFSVQVAVAAVLVDETSVAVQAIQEALAAVDKTLLTEAAAAVAA